MTTPYIIFSKKHCKFIRPCVVENYGYIKYELPFINALAVEVPEEKVENLKKHRLVAMVAQDSTVSKLPLEGCHTTPSPHSLYAESSSDNDSEHRLFAINDNNSNTKDYGYMSRQERLALSFSENGGYGTTIAVIDTGVAPHYDLVKPYNRIVAFKDFVNGRSEPYDDDGHGTHVAGIAAGSGYAGGNGHRMKNHSLAKPAASDISPTICANSEACTHANLLHHASPRPIIGTAPLANIAALKALDENGGGATSDILAAMQWVMDNKERYNIRVLNLSLGVDASDDNSDSIDPLILATTALSASGVLVVCAAGNSGPGRATITSPGTNPLALTVGSCHNGDIPKFSSRGPTQLGFHKPDLVAPGVDIVSLDAKTGKTYIAHTGTSMSCPYVSGAAACIFSAQPNLTPQGVKRILYKMLSPLPNTPRDFQGRGALTDFSL